MPSSSVMSKYASARRARGYKPYSSVASKYHSKLRAAVLRRKSFIPSLALTRGSELKHYQSTNATFAGSVAGSCDGITAGIQVGNTDNTRVGKNICLKRVQFKGIFTHNLAGGATEAGRVIVVYDTMINAGTVASIPLLLPDATGGFVYSTQNPDYTGRFRVLFDKTLLLSKVDSGNTIAQFDADIPVNLPVDYTSVVGATWPHGSVSALFFVAKGAANPADWAYTFSVSYTDD